MVQILVMEDNRSSLQVLFHYIEKIGITPIPAETGAHKLDAANQELKRFALLDGLTGIANCRHFDEVLDREWRRAVRIRSATETCEDGKKEPGKDRRSPTRSMLRSKLRNYSSTRAAP